MANGKLTFRYDELADILYVDQCLPYGGQESEEIGDNVIARLNPESGAIENLEVLFFSKRVMGEGTLELPINGELRLAG
ncbi:DUF2283 domain-containing protein [filamentous cyanobacterium CCP5]|nr:DUF2283 domain-containing protein [filamentous cyanobacterium CCP5]